ncbi:NAD(P)-binding domain-containing protein [Pseudomonas sp. ZM23]|uniref:NAD(P)-binding domain-containing protein n=1 Tax=Pseudomonas triclosanedens TaxID=2961893 RepID=A0ABY6ZSX0_9PSED|nr:NAD(P)-binding domain-containing protein [Pseudomonas triclosanedens]MCP8467292.1 NAD(P)-binding domain-containing protein [Pseudomonas triclosanedens]MCP8472619.1 NAD(P)-binding domain-containing protein [Pseudomonas triclosanedens]MCP8478680.1 NAD(P)-binding domain-containing protein [Pseudomonas triclosanedens]WAI47855.1 NAD(P)-binding domain-containing protein [Pseudomonas triclosanedens]
MHAIIGAGPSGLAAARQLQKYGIPFTGFDLHGDVGGLWDIDNPHSTLYRSAHLISSKGTTQFDEFPMDMDVPPYPHHSQVLRYFRGYAQHYGLREHYRFNTRVIALLRQDHGWKLRCERNGEVHEGLFDGVLIANGTLHTPNLPHLPGAFDGEVLHSSQYRGAECFDGKRVLIVGCGNSACDIAVDAVHRARSVDISVRRGYHFLPKFCMGRPIDTFGGMIRLPRPLKQRLDAAFVRLLLGRPSDYGLPDPDHRLYESHPVVNSLVLHHLAHGDIRARRNVRSVDGQRVAFSDGERADYDLILFATGYHLDYPFIDRAQLNWPKNQPAPQLYLNMFHPQHDDLFMLGMVEASGLGWQGRAEQAELVALYIRQLAAGNPAAERLRQLKKTHAQQRIDGGYRYLPLDRMAHYVHKDSYRRALHEHIADLRRDLPRTAPLAPLAAH